MMLNMDFAEYKEIDTAATLCLKSPASGVRAAPLNKPQRKVAMPHHWFCFNRLAILFAMTTQVVRKSWSAMKCSQMNMVTIQRALICVIQLALLIPRLAIKAVAYS